MSDLIPPPYELGTPEYDEYVRGTTRALTVPGSAIPAGALAQVLPPANTPGVGGYVPGIASGLGSMVGHILVGAGHAAGAAGHAAENYVRDKIGLAPAPSPSAATPDWLSSLDKLYEGSVDRAKSIIPPVAPENPTEQVAQDAGLSVGSMAVPIPGAAVAKVVPKIAQPLVKEVMHWVAPVASGGSATVPLTAAATLPLLAGTIDEATAAPNATTPQTSPGAPVPAQSTQTRPVSQTSQQSEQPQWVWPKPTADQPQWTWPKPANDGSTPPIDDGGNSGVTGKDLLLGGATAVLGALGLRYGTRRLGRALESDSYLRNADAFNTAQSVRAAGDPAQTMQMKEQPTAPLAMQPEQRLAQAVRTNLQDSNATIAGHMKEVAQTDKDIAHEIGNVNNNMSINTRIQNQFETGVHEPTGITQPSFATLSRDIGRLSPEEQQVLHSGLWSRSAANNRADLFNKALHAGEDISDPTKFRTGLYNLSDETLRQNIAAMESNPKLNEIADRFRASNLSDMDIAKASGFPTDVIDRLKQVNPDYVPTVDATGNTAHTFGLRDTDPYIGLEIPATTPWHALAQHKNDLYKLIEQNTLKGKIVDASLAAQDKNPQMARMFELKTDGQGKPVADIHDQTSVTVFRPDGAKTYRVGNAEIAHALNTNPRQTRAYMGLARRWYNRGVTGPLAMVGGKVFPFVNAARSAYYLPTNMPRGMASGYLDKLFQSATGKNLRLLTPDIPISMVHAGLSDAANLTMHGVANGLEPGARNVFNHVLRKTLGDAHVDTMRASLMQRYMASITHEMRARGVVGGLGYGHTELPAYRSNIQGKRMSNPAFDMAPATYRARNPFTRAVMPYTVGVKKMLNEAFDVVNNMGHSHAYRVNRNNPNISPARLVSEVRQLTGDMGKSGSGKITQAINEMVPFTNAATQDIAQLGRTFADRPAATVLSHLGNMGMLAAGSLLTAMHAKGGLDHLYNSLTTNQRASGPVYYTDANDPTKFTQLSLPQNIRGIYPIILDMMGHTMHAWDARHNEGAFDRAYHTLSDLMSHHVSNNAVTSALHGGSQAIDPYTSLPPAVNAIVNATGKQWSLHPDDIVQGVQEGKPISQMAGRDLTGRARVPNQAGGDTGLDTANGSVLTHVLSSVLGIAGNAWETAERGMSSAKHGGDWFNAMSDNFIQHVKDNNPMFNNVLWKNSARVSPYSPLVEATDKSLAAIEKTLPAKNDLRYEGATRRGGATVSGLGDTNVSSDQLVQQMYIASGRLGQYINAKFKPQVSDVRKLMADLNNTSGSEEYKRLKGNEYAGKINDIYHDQIAPLVGKLNDRLSEMAGKRVDVRNIDWTKGREQFQ